MSFLSCIPLIPHHYVLIMTVPDYIQDSHGKSWYFLQYIGSWVPSELGGHPIGCPLLWCGPFSYQSYFHSVHTVNYLNNEQLEVQNYGKYLKSEYIYGSHSLEKCHRRVEMHSWCYFFFLQYTNWTLGSDTLGQIVILSFACVYFHLFAKRKWYFRKC